MKLKAIQNTVLKQAIEDYFSLSEQDRLCLQPGEVLSIYDWKLLDRNYLKIVLDMSAENLTQTTWFAYIPHVQLLSEHGEVQVIPQRSLPSEVQLLDVPHNNQVDDELTPTGACHVTSFAIVMAYFRVKRARNNIWLMEDEVYQHLQVNGLNHWNPEDLVKMANHYGLKDEFTTRGCLSDIRQAIAEGNPCIVYGHFKHPSSTIVIKGYDQNGFFVNDPYGKWTPSGYRSDLSGENLYYSNAFIQSKCSPQGESHLWVHFISNRKNSLIDCQLAKGIIAS